MEKIDQVFQGSQTSGNSNDCYVAKSVNQFIDVFINVSAADVVCSYTVQSTAEPQSSYVTDTSGVAISALPTGITYTNGVVSVASPAIGSYRVRLRLTSGPWLRVAYAYTSGAVVTTRVLVTAHD